MDVRRKRGSLPTSSPVFGQKKRRIISKTNAISSSQEVSNSKPCIPNTSFTLYEMEETPDQPIINESNKEINEVNIQPKVEKFSDSESDREIKFRKKLKKKRKGKSVQ